MCEQKHCNRKGCENHVSENRKDGFCSTDCKKTDEVIKFIALKDCYSELMLPMSILNKEKNTISKRICKLESCENELKSRESKTKYCSNKCAAESKKKYANCKHCKTKFHITKGKKVYCSRACNLESIKVERICTHPDCTNKIRWRHKGAKYCSSECYQKIKGANAIRFTICQHTECNSPLTKKQTYYGQKYCGAKCSLDARKLMMGDGIGKISMRKEKKWEYPRRFIKTANGWILVSRNTWEKVNGPIPPYHFIAYKDENTFNDEDIDNLYLVHISKALSYKNTVNKEDITIVETEIKIDDFFKLK